VEKALTKKKKRKRKRMGKRKNKNKNKMKKRKKKKKKRNKNEISGLFLSLEHDYLQINECSCVKTVLIALQRS